MRRGTGVGGEGEGGGLVRGLGGSIRVVEFCGTLEAICGGYVLTKKISNWTILRLF